MGLIKALFYQGEYLKVLEKTYESKKKTDSSEYIYVLGSLSFLGRTQEAEAYYKSLQPHLSRLDQAFSYFFLAVSFTRRSQLKKARSYLKLSKTLYKADLGKSTKSKNVAQTEIKFLVEQGFSFFLFYLGRYNRALYFSQKSLSSAIKTENFWFRALAYDLLANNLVMTGKIHEGLVHFHEASKYSKKLNNLALIDATQSSELICRNEFGIQIKASFLELEEKFDLLRNKDSFTKSNLGLELARQYTLRGQWKKALDVLTSISQLIYQSQNRRQEARLNLRWAEIFYLKNDLVTCQHYLRSGKRCLQFVDESYELPFLGLELKILKESDSQLIEIKKRFFELTEKINLIKNNNIITREKYNNQALPTSSDDQIHQMLLKASENKAQAKEIILESQLYSFIYKFFDLQRGNNYVLLNFKRKSLTTMSSYGISHKENELTPLHFKLLQTLKAHFITKEDLVEKVWGYKYDPLRHDTLIYSAFTQLRKLLMPESSFIETTERGYKLNAEVVNFMNYQETDLIIKQNGSLENLSLSSNDLATVIQQGFNSRQIQILEFLQKNLFISVKSAVQLFSTSEITANRDLRSLFQNKYVLRVGQGRAIRYTRNPKKEIL